MLFWLYIILLSLHLAAMNVAGGAPLVSCWLEWRERKAGPIVRAAADYLAIAALVSLLAGVLLGLGIVGLRWSPAFVELWTGPMARKMYWGLGELAFSLILAIAYLAWRRNSATPTSFTRSARMLLPLLSGTNLLYHFPALFLVASRLAEDGITSGRSLTAAEFRREMLSGTTPAMIVHIVLASLAGAGIALLGLVLRWQRHGRPSGDVQTLSRSAALLALLPTVLQILVGIWILVSMGSFTQSRIMGGSLTAAICFMVGILTAFWLMQLLAALAFGEAERSLMIKSMAAFLATIFLMTAAWHSARLPDDAAGSAVQSGPRNGSSPAENQQVGPFLPLSPNPWGRTKIGNPCGRELAQIQDLAPRFD